MNNVFDAMAWAIRVSRGEPMAARMLLIIGLAQRVGNDDDDFLVWPSIKQIAFDTDMSRTSIKKWMRHLEEKGFVQRFEVKRENGTNSSNRYRLAVRSNQYHPTKGLMSDDSDMGRNSTGAGRDSATPTGRSSRPPIEQPLEQPLEDEASSPPPDGELPLGLDPIPPKDPTPEDLAEFIEREWAARACLAPLRGGRLNDSMKEKAAKLARAVMVDGDTIVTVWRDVFAKIDGSAWLQGKVPGRDGRAAFRLDMTTLLQKRIFDKAIGGSYDGQSTGEQRRGSTSQATGNFLNRIRSGQGRGSGGGGTGRALARG